MKTKFQFYALPNRQAYTVGYGMVVEFISTFGCSSQLHSDQGKEFKSALFSAIYDKLDIDKTRTCPYRPLL